MKSSRQLAWEVPTESAFEAGKPRRLFEKRFDRSPYGDPHYDVSPDGRHFVMVSLGEEPGPERVQVVVNWLEELKSRRRNTRGAAKAR